MSGGALYGGNAFMRRFRNSRNPSGIQERTSRHLRISTSKQHWTRQVLAVHSRRRTLLSTRSSEPRLYHLRQRTGTRPTVQKAHCVGAALTNSKVNFGFRRKVNALVSEL